MGISNYGYIKVRLDFYGSLNGLRRQAALEEEDEDHERGKRSENERYQPEPDVFAADARLVEHPDKEPNEQAGIVQNDPLGRVSLEDAGALRWALEEEGSQ